MFPSSSSTEEKVIGGHRVCRRTRDLLEVSSIFCRVRLWVTEEEEEEDAVTSDGRRRPTEVGGLSAEA